MLVPRLIEWERLQAPRVLGRFSEVTANPVAIDATGVTLSGRADRIHLLAGGRSADIIDFKTGAHPSRKQAQTLLSPQLALEGALLARGAFRDLGAVQPADLVHVRLKPDGRIGHESVLVKGNGRMPADALVEDAWAHLARLVAYYGDEGNGYRSRALPQREHDTGGDYDHLARVLEWSAGFDGEAGEE
jgi:ATP-dependent helicase/nuclease subunit B